MKRIRIDLNKLDSSSKQPKKLSDALTDAKEDKQGFTKTYVATGNLIPIPDFTKTFVASGKTPAPQAS